MIFAREINDPLTGLVKQVEKATNDNKGLRSFVVFCSDDESLKDKVKALAEKEGLKNTALTIDNPAGPRGYNIPKEADVTVVLYVKKTVKANHAYKKGEFKEGEIEKIIADVPKIVK
jgi:hypothetical protein